MENETLEEKPDLTHEDVKAFMNEPEAEEPKAPAPFMLDDIAPMEVQESVQDLTRLSTQQIAQMAWLAAYTAARNVQQEWMPDSIQNCWTEWTNFVINTAANPNNPDVCREIYEYEFMKARENDEYWIPWSKLKPQERLPWLIFRAVVVQSLTVWAGH